MSNGIIFLGFAFAIAAIAGIAFNIRDAILDSTDRMKDPFGDFPHMGNKK